jgi:hypothetical protein
MRRYHDSHGQARLYARIFWIDQLEHNMLLQLLRRGRPRVPGTGGDSSIASHGTPHIGAVAVRVGVSTMRVRSMSVGVLVALLAIVYQGSITLGSASQHICEVHIAALPTLLRSGMVRYTCLMGLGSQTGE